MRDQAPSVVRLAEVGLGELRRLLRAYDLSLSMTPPEASIPGSFWGDGEAGLIDRQVHVRADTPVHSLLHELGHYICMTPDRRILLHTDAGGDYAEENAVCYLQILLADSLSTVGRDRIMLDMDAWGYSFRLGCARAWFESDAEDAHQTLYHWQLIDDQDRVHIGRVRTSPEPSLTP